MHKNVLQRLGLENALRAAWKNREFEVYYQPVVDLETNEINGLRHSCAGNHPPEKKCSLRFLFPSWKRMA